ncbi:hypothetical protein FNV43_RR27093 [Rhamnella rubrinervis]|uniref:Uncharacterized protein n=1 Tax=Rhamnella rubrinervis TaxID=2594499 RepID=A0A8K0DNT1_9ROSA|nr:hypothetical protein FNV43_RR27093 [Rhamnella rubrinervis]
MWSRGHKEQETKKRVMPPSSVSVGLAEHKKQESEKPDMATSAGSDGLTEHEKQESEKPAGYASIFRIKWT